MQRFCRQIFRLSLPIQRRALPPIFQSNLISHPKFHFSQSNNNSNLNTQEINFESQDSFYKPIPLKKKILTAIITQTPQHLSANIQKHLDFYQSGKDASSFSEEETLEIFRALSHIALYSITMGTSKISKQWYHHALLFGSHVKQDKFTHADLVAYSLMGDEAFLLGEHDLATQFVDNMISIIGVDEDLTQDTGILLLEGLSLRSKIQTARQEPQEVINQTLQESLLLSTLVVDTFDVYDQKADVVFKKLINLLEKLGTPEEIEKYAVKAINLADQTFGEDHVVHCQTAYQALLQVLLAQKRYSEALVYAERLYFDKSETLEEVDHLAAGIVLTKIHFEMGDFKAAIKIFEEIEKYSKNIFSGVWGFGIYFEMAKSYLSLGDLKKAHECFLKEVEFTKMKSGELSRDMCICWENGAHIFAPFEEFRKESKMYYEKAIEVSEKIGMPQKERLHFKIMYASFLYKWGDFAASLRYAKEAESLSGGLEPSQETELLFSTLALNHGQLKEFKEVFKYFEKAIDHCEVNRMTSGKMLNYHLSLIDAYHFFSDEKMVAKWIARTLNVVEKICEDSMLLEIYRPSIGAIVGWFTEKGKTEEAAKVIKLLKK